jgi:hypothetical protein
MADKPKQFKPIHRQENGFKKFDGHAAWDALYKTPAWTKYREKFLAINQKCYSCGHKATVVDHLVAHKGDINLFMKLDNHIPLCDKCHNFITGKFDRGPIQKITEKLMFLSSNRQRNNLDFKIKVLPKYQ